jgi:hypothetical protein
MKHMDILIYLFRWSSLLFIVYLLFLVGSIFLKVILGALAVFLLVAFYKVNKANQDKVVEVEYIEINEDDR